MKRREFIMLLGPAVAWPLAARAQGDRRTRRIGILTTYPESHPVAQSNLAVFREVLQKLWWMEGRNIRIDARWGTGDAESLKRSAKELVGLQPNLFLSNNSPTTSLCCSIHELSPSSLRAFPIQLGAAS